jgi:GT2 family glycosyltransferase
MGRRKPVSVVVPFLGSHEDAERLGNNMGSLKLAEGDQVIVADNTGKGIAEAVAGSAVRVVDASGERSSYHARNVGAREAQSDWILFMDADCSPAPAILGAYFAERIPKRCGVVAGQIVGNPRQRSLVARYTRSRNFFDQTDGMHAKDRGAAATGNLLVRRAAFEAVGGFAEGIRSAGDIDLCWRLQQAGWTLEHRPKAIVEHRHREGLFSLLGAVARYGAGSRWLNERYEGSASRWPLGPGLVGCARDVAGHAVRGQVEPAVFRVLDGLGLVAHNVGYRSGNSVSKR